MPILTFHGATDSGLCRDDNQDTFICTRLWAPHLTLLAVIDGVGGYRGGGKAASIARDTMIELTRELNGTTPTRLLQEAVTTANNRIYAEGRQDEKLASMCCVMTAAIVDTDSNTLYFCHVGDTRLYRCQHGKLTKLTHDHSVVGMREETGKLTEEEAMKHPRRNEVTQVVGLEPHSINDPDFLESGETSYEPGDILLLCSDGLTDMITSVTIKEILAQQPPLTNCVKALINAANAAGGADNITVVLATSQLPDQTTEFKYVPQALSQSLPVDVPSTVNQQDSPLSHTPSTNQFEPDEQLLPEPVAGNRLPTTFGAFIGWLLLALLTGAGLGWWGNSLYRTTGKVTPTQSMTDSTQRLLISDTVAVVRGTSGTLVLSGTSTAGTATAASSATGTMPMNPPQSLTSPTARR